MNIFEQYGIKEIADVTLYGITTNKYGEKIYIPVLFFDTLKVSSLDQTSEQTTARGGLGNAEHILWNYGKTLSFNIEDALYTSASQNLMWGGLYGLSNIKIKGRWNPYTYEDGIGYSLERTTWKKTVQHFWDLKNEPRDGDKNIFINSNNTLKSVAIYNIVMSGSDPSFDQSYEEPIITKEGDNNYTIQYIPIGSDTQIEKRDLVNEPSKTKKIISLIEGIDYVRIYIPCEEQIGYAYIKQTPGKYKYNIEGNNKSGKKVTRNNKDIRIWDINNEKDKRDLYIYDREWFSNIAANNMESVELQINNFNDFKNKILKADEYQLNEKPKPEKEYLKTFNQITQGFNYLDQYMNWVLRFFPESYEERLEKITTFPYYFRFAYIETGTYQGKEIKWYSTWIFITRHDKLSYIMDSENKYVIDFQDEDGNIVGDGKFIPGRDFITIHFYTTSSGGGSGGHSTQDFKDSLVKSHLTLGDFVYDTNIDWGFGSEENPIKNNIHEYQWKDCNVSLISQSNNSNNVSINDEINICYHTLDNNSNKSIYFYDNGYWQSRKTLSTEVSCRITNIDGDEYILKTKIPLGDFYIVQDENYIIPTVEKFINPLNSGMENRKILDNFQSFTAKEQFAIDVDKNLKSYNLSLLPEYAKTKISVYYNPKTMKPYSGNEYYYTNKNGVTLQGNFQVIKQGEVYYKWIRDVADYGTCIGQSVNINKNNFPYNFRLVGNTYIRDRYGEDQNYQIELYNCAILDNININLSAAGEPTTVNIKMKALTDNIGDIGRLTISKQLESGTTQNNNYVPIDILEVLSSIPTEYRIQLLYPQPNTIYCLPKDCTISTYPDEQNYTYLELFSDQPSNWEGLTYTQYQNKLIDEGRLKKNSLVLVKIDERDIVRDLITPSEIKNYNFAIGN